MDHASMHLKDIIIEVIEKFDSIVSFLPKSLIFCLQPLEVSVNRLLKDEIKKKYVCFCMNQNKKEEIEIWSSIGLQIYDWYNSSAINKDLIYNSSRICVLSNQLDRSENYLFKGFNLLQQKIVIDEDKDVNGKIVEGIIDENDLLNEME